MIAASDDQIVPDLALDVVEYGATELTTINGADHFFRDLYADEAVDAALQFLRRHGWR